MTSSRFGNLRQTIGGMDSVIADAARQRAANQARRGTLQNRRRLFKESRESLGRMADFMGRGGVDPGAVANAVIGIQDAQAIGPEAGRLYRREVARDFAPQMPRGLFGGQMGFMEAVNTGIAENPNVRHIVLPAAIVGGSAMALGGVTAGAQRLWELMGFLEQGTAQQERIQQSPLIDQNSLMG